jgi:hypothetical protein
MSPELPSDFQSAQIKVYRVHRVWFYTLISFSIFFFVLIVALTGVDQDGVKGCLRMIAWILFLGFGVIAGLAYFDHLCRKLGYVCPHCHKTLYEPKGQVLVTGICPRCKKSII